jgi:hypothetical protein
MKRFLALLWVVVFLSGCIGQNQPIVTPAVSLVIPAPVGTATEPSAPPLVVTHPAELLEEAVTATFPTPDVADSPADPAFGQQNETSVLVEPVVAGAVTTIAEPLLIDGERGRLYAQAQVNAQPKTVVLSTVDGRLLATFEPNGRLALDRTHNRLVVDQGEAGLLVLDAADGRVITRVALPPAVPVTPQVNPTNGLIYAFRDRTVYLIHPLTGAIERTVELSIETLVCGQPGNPAAITGSDYDMVNGKLYLTFITYACTPWVGVTIVVYEAATMTELGRQGAEIRYQAVAFGDNLYGTSVSRLGPASYWAWNEGGTWYQEGTSEYGGNPAGMVADWGRQLVYEAIGQQVRIIEPATRNLMKEVEVGLLANDGRLAGHDPISDNLYFLSSDGRLSLWPAVNLFGASQIAPPAPEAVPTTAVYSLIIAADGTLAGLWDNGDCLDEGNVLYLLRPGADWFHAQVNHDGRCDSIAAVVLSPNFEQDGAMFVATNNSGGVWKSSDGGQSWQPAGEPFAGGERFKALLISPGYSQDQTLLAQTSSGQLYRSADGGQAWSMVGAFDEVAMSPDFGEDWVVMASAGSQLFISRDGGANWQMVGSTPNGERLALLSVGPLFSRWSVVFAFTVSGGFYRSLDGGLTWQFTMGTAYERPLQLVYAPDMEVDRPIFLLHGRMLDASYDGWNSTWSGGPGDRLRNIVVTAMAASPNFANDGLLYVGTAGGQVMSVAAERPEFGD